MNRQEFKIQENRMTSFLNWFRDVVKSPLSIDRDQYEEIFYNVKEKAL